MRNFCHLIKRRVLLLLLCFFALTNTSFAHVCSIACPLWRYWLQFRYMKIGIFFVISNDTNGSIILFSSFILCVSDFFLLCVYCFHIWGVKVHTRNVFICFECAVSADKYARTRMRIAIISFVFFFIFKCFKRNKLCGLP